MSAISNNSAIELFKEVYGMMHDIVPDDQLIGNDIKWSDDKKVGEKFVEDVVLGAEVGISLGGSGQEAFEISSAIAGNVRQTEVVPYVSVLPSILPFATISRSAGGDRVAFMNATKFIVKNNLKSHNKFLEIFRIHGQSPAMLGYVSYYTGTYRGASFTNGTGVLNGITFTNGINAASKLILFNQGYFAAGIWVGMKGVKVKQVDSNDAVLASGKLVSVNAKYGYIEVDFTPVAPSAAPGVITAAVTSGTVRLCFDKMETDQEMVGLKKILTTNGTLFGINNAVFELFRGSYSNFGQKKDSLSRTQEAVADAVNGSGLEGDVVVYVNPRSWKTFAETEAGLRVYDQSYSPAKAVNGFRDIEFYTQTGKMTVKAHRMVMEGEQFILKLDTWSRSGSAQLGFKVPGMESSGDLIKPLENQAGFQFKSYADQYIFTFAPAQNIYCDGINDESVS
jgi:hypothetical protein